MKHLIFALAFIVAGCASTGTTDAYQAAEKALIAAHDLHAAVADALVVAAPALSASQKAEAKEMLDQSEAILVEADGLTDAASIMADVTKANALSTNARSAVK